MVSRTRPWAGRARAADRAVRDALTVGPLRAVWAAAPPKTGRDGAPGARRPDIAFDTPLRVLAMPVVCGAVTVGAVAGARATLPAASLAVPFVMATGAAALAALYLAAGRPAGWASAVQGVLSLAVLAGGPRFAYTDPRLTVAAATLVLPLAIAAAAVAVRSMVAMLDAPTWHRFALVAWLGAALALGLRLDSGVFWAFGSPVALTLLGLCAVATLALGQTRWFAAPSHVSHAVPVALALAVVVSLPVAGALGRPPGAGPAAPERVDRRTAAVARHAPRPTDPDGDAAASDRT